MRLSRGTGLADALGRGTGAFDALPRADVAWGRRLIAALARFADADLAVRVTGRRTDLSAPAAPLPVVDGPEDFPLREQVRDVMAAMQGTTPDRLAVDADGDIAVRAGSAVVFVRVRDDPPLVDVFCPVLTEVERSEALYERLSEFTGRMPVGRVYLAGGVVWASVPVFGRDFQAKHLELAVMVMVGLADELADRLQDEFGGRQFLAGAGTGAARDRSGPGLATSAGPRSPGSLPPLREPEFEPAAAALLATMLDSATAVAAR